MPELPTIEIRSPKDPETKWIINLVDYNPSIHTKWGEAMPAVIEVEPEPEVVTEPEPEVATEPESEEEEEEQEEESHAPEPSVQDFVQDDAGNEFVNIINPANQRMRLQIAASEYNPDEHRLWSTHPRFQR
jgi:hypothetical protein